MIRFSLRTCALCGHAKTAHQHYRAGTDCSRCVCLRFRRLLTGWFR